ncbi:MAG: hypothetical protein C4522_15070 [Desulfobacteraceae bacterium]|nr:MAG: hypothetical protein C4522_15070 [Desulfobacteraceae bacterium]
MKKTIILLFMCLSLVSVGAVSAYEGLGNVEIHGFISQGYIQSTDYDYSGIKTEDGSFEFNEMGINFSTTPADGLRLGAQFFARDMGELGNDNIELDWAYGDYRVNNYLGIRAGKVKIALGLYNETRDVDAVRTSIMLPNAIYVEQNRDVYAGLKGVGAYGELPGGFSYQLAYGVGGVSAESNLLIDMATIMEDRLKTGIQSAAAAAYEAGALQLGLPAAIAAAYGQQQGELAAAEVSVESPSSATPLNTQNASLQWAPRFVDGLRLSGTWLFTEIETTMNISTPNLTLAGVNGGNTVTTAVNIDNVSSIVGSVEYTRGDTILSAEYNMIRVDIGNVLINGNPTDIATTEVIGWAVSASHRFTYWFELGAYYSDWNTNVRDRHGKDFEALQGNRHREERWMRDTCLTTRFDLNENWIFKLEGHYMNGLDDVDFGNDPDPDPHWYLFASKLSYSF